jgi:hypothetical protein
MLPFPSSTIDDDSRWMATGADGGGLWPVKRVVGRHVTKHKRTGVERTEYLIRWVGFDKSYDRWRPSSELQSIQPLINAYEEAFPPPFSPVARTPGPDDVPPPPPSDEAILRRRFRSDASPSTTSLAPTDDTCSPCSPVVDETAPDLSTPLEHTVPSPAVPTAQPPPASILPSPPSRPPPRDRTQPPPLPPQSPPPPIMPPASHYDTSDRFPVGSRVRVYYDLLKRSWPGTVVKSRVTRPRTAGVHADRRITVAYDDPAYQGETFEHDLGTSSITLLQLPLAPASPTIAARRSRRLQAAACAALGSPEAYCTHAIASRIDDSSWCNLSWLFTP